LKTGYCQKKHNCAWHCAQWC